MSRIKAIDPSQATGRTKELLEAVNEKYGMTPNLIRTLANSSAALEGYLALGEAIEGGVLSAKLREQIALTVSVANGCGYCEAAHSAVGRSVGLSDIEISDARQSTSPDRRADVALRFAQEVVKTRGWVDDEHLKQLRQVGLGDAEIAEIVAVVAWKIFSNYFNHIAGTEVDFDLTDKSANT